MLAFNFEHFFTNLSFVSLLFLLVFHWAHASFFLNPVIGLYGMGVANIALTLLLLIRWVTSNHFPLSNLYESLLFLSWSFTALHLVLQKSNHFPFLGLITTPMALFTNAFATFTLPPEMQRATGLVPALQSNWLMMHVTIMIVSYAALLSGCLLSMAFLIVQYAESRERSGLARFTRGDSLFAKRETPLVKRSIFAQREGEEKVVSQDNSEASRSESLLVSRTLAKRGARSPLLAPRETSGDSLLAPREARKRSGRSNTSTVSVSSLLQSESLLEGTMALRSEWEDDSSKQNIDSPLTSRLDNLSYRILGLGFPLLTIGILSGAVWANEAWGSYWSWDPKETWALITWLVFAIYLHTRLTKNWSGTKPAIIATIGFFVLWICYLGVNLLGTGLHSYGWFQR